MFEVCRGHGDIHVLTPSFPTSHSSDLNNQTKQLCCFAQNGPRLPSLRSAYRTTAPAGLPAWPWTGKPRDRHAKSGSAAWTGTAGVGAGKPAPSFSLEVGA